MIHVYGAVMTAQSLASNNRGESEGNLSTLRKIIWTDQGVTSTHSSVSAEALRFALRRNLERNNPGSCNRVYDYETRMNTWRSGGGFDPVKYVDDDVFGFMHAKAGDSSEETTSEETTPVDNNTKKKDKPKVKGTASVRRSVLEVSPAVSTSPWHGDVLFCVASPGATGDAVKGAAANPKPYSVETHSTSYQWGFAMTPGDLKVPTRASEVLDRIVDLSSVAGNQARFAFDFAPESIVLRLTHDFSPRVFYPYVESEGRVTIPGLIRKVVAGDINPKELVLGGKVVTDLSPEDRLALQGAVLVEGVVRAADTFKTLLAQAIQ